MPLQMVRNVFLAGWEKDAQPDGSESAGGSQIHVPGKSSSFCPLLRKEPRANLCFTEIPKP